MRRRFVLNIIFLCWLTACSSKAFDKSTKPVIDSPTPIHLSSPTRLAKILTSTSTVPVSSVTKVATSTLTPPVVTITTDIKKPITPQIVQLCPNQSETTIENLGLDQNEFLVVELYNETTGKKLLPSETGAAVVTFDNPIPQQVPNTAIKDGLSLVKYYLAADQRSIELVYEDSEKLHRQVWRSSWDGKYQRKVEEYDLVPLPANQSRWELGDSQYMVYEWNPNDPSTGIYSHPLSMHNRKTGESWNLSFFPEKTIILTSFILDGEPYLVNLEENRAGSSLSTAYNFSLYNLTTLEKKPAFQWLSGKDWVDWLTAHIVYLGDEHFTIIVPRTYGLDIGVDLDLGTILSLKKYEEVMQAIYLPGGDLSVNLFQGGYLHSKNGMVLIPQPINDMPRPLYFLDFQGMNLQDYCFFLEDPRTTSLYATFVVDPSDRFIAFTKTQFGLPDNPGGQSIKAVELLDLETGYFASFPEANFGVIGWAKK